MPEQLSDQQLALQANIQKFIDQELAPRQHQSSTEVRDDIVKAAKAFGLFQMTQPKEYGGTSAGTLELCLVRDELGAANLPHSGLVFGPGPGVLGGCDEPLKSTHLGPQLTGAKRSAFGFTEPDNAPQPTRGETTADVLTINGQKSYVTGGADADFISTLVQVDGKPAMVVVDTNLPGVVLERKFSSLDGSHHAAFSFDDVQVPVSHIIGKPGDGLPRAMGQIGDTRLSIAANCVGLMRWILAYTTEHIKQPDRSGKPRGDKEGVRMRYSDARIRAFAARSMLYRTARLADAGENIVNESIACKHFATEQIQPVLDIAIQLVGGAALVDDHPLAILYKQVRALRLTEGASDVLLLNLARGKLELDRGRI